MTQTQENEMGTYEETVLKIRVFKRMASEKMRKQYNDKWSLFYSSNDKASCFEVASEINLNLYEVKIVESKEETVIERLAI